MDDHAPPEGPYRYNFWIGECMSLQAVIWWGPLHLLDMLTTPPDSDSVSEGDNHSRSEDLVDPKDENADPTRPTVRQ